MQRNQVKCGRRSRRRRLSVERLSSRLVLSGSQFAGNDCPPDLDLSSVPSQTVEVGEALTLNLSAAGATVTDLDDSDQPTGDTIRFLLDPDIGTDTPEGISITSEGELSWTPTQSQIGTHRIVIIALDAGSPVLADAETLEIVVTEVTAGPPVVDLNGEDDGGIDFETTFVEDDGVVAIVDADLTVANPLGSTISSAEILLTNPLDGASESLSVDTAGTAIDVEYDSVTGTLSLTNSDSVGNYEQVLRSLVYLNTSQVPTTNSPRVVDITVTSDDLTSAAATATVNVVAMTDPPVVDLNGADDGGLGFQTTFTEGGDAVAIVDTDLLVENLEGTTISSAQIQLTNPLDGDSESLSVDTSGTSIDAAYDAVTSTLNLTNVDSVANYQQVLRTLIYANSSDDPATTAPRLVDVTVTSNGFESGTATATINVVAVNDLPNLLPIADQSIELNQPLTIPLTVVDPDSGDTITFFLDPDDSPATATIEPAQSAGRTAELRWTPSDADGVGSFVFRVLVTDNGDPAGVDQETFTVEVTPATTSLSVDLNGDEAGIDDVATHNENDETSVIANPNLSIDSSEAEISFVTFSLLTRPDGDQERLRVTTAAGITPSVDDEPGFYAVTLDGPATTEQFENVLKSLSYENTSDTPSTDVRRIQVIAFVGGFPSNPAFIDLSIIPENDPPSIMAIDDQNAVVGEELIVPLTATDPEGDSLSFEITSGPDSASLQPGDAGAATFMWTPTSADADTNVTFEITVTDDGNPPLTSTAESFLVTVSPAMTANDDTIAGAQLVALAVGSEETLAGRIDPFSDVDMYAFDLEAGQKLSATPGEFNTPFPGRFSARFFADDGTPIVAQDSETFTPFIVAETTGRFYVGISAPNNTSYDAVTGPDLPGVAMPVVADYTVVFALDVAPAQQAAAARSPSVTSLSASSSEAAVIDEVFAKGIGSGLLSYRAR